MSERFKWIAANTAMALSLYLGFVHQVAWVRFIVICLVWAMLASYGTVFFYEDLRTKFSGKGAPVSGWVSHCTDVLFSLILVSTGWYVTAIAYVLSALCLVLIYATPTGGKIVSLYVKLAIAAVLLLAIELAWLLRWEVIPVQTQEIPVAYQLDRWSGNVYFLGAPVGGRIRLQDR